MSHAPMKGMNPGELEAYAKVLDAAAAEVMLTVLGLTYQLTHMQWQGSDALAAREHWRTQIQAQVENVVADLHACAGTAREQASEQRNISRS